MDNGSILLGIAVLASICLPFAFMIRGQRKRTKKLLNTLDELANKEQSKIGLHEVCGDMAIGFNEEQDKIFFIKNINENPVESVVDLKKVQQCKFVNTPKAIHGDHGNFNVIDKLLIRFSNKTKESADASFLIYDSEESLQLSGELQLAEKWEKLINDRLKNSQ